MERKTSIRVSSKGQIVLPKRLRERLGLLEGDYVIAHEMADGVFLEKQPKTRFDEIVERFQQEAKRIGYTRKDLERDIKAVRKERVERERAESATKADNS